MSSEYVNYARTPVEVKAARLRLSHRRRVVIGICFVLLIIAVVATVFLVLSFSAQENVERMAPSFHIVHDTPPASGDLPVDASGEAPAEDEINWEGVIEDTGGTPATAWINVPSHGIDFAVAQWADNEYGLHHDIYGNYSWAGVFMDCDASYSGRNVVIYGHTLYGGGMFSGLSSARYQSEFNNIGTVRYSTPDVGFSDYTPIACLNVDPSDTEIRTFSFEPTSEQVSRARHAVLLQHASAGEFNVVDTKYVASLPKDNVASSGQEGASSSSLPVDVKVVNNESEIDASSSVRVESGKWWTLTSSDLAEAEQLAETYAWRDWVSGLDDRRSSGRSDSKEIIANSSQSVVLACCSWPFNNHRTLVIAVR